MRMRFLLAVAALGLLAGCGGGGGAGGGSGPAPSSSKSEARFDVDLRTGKVTIAPAGGRAAFQGGAVSFTSSDLLSAGGDAGQRLIRIAAKNNSGHTWGGSPVKLIISDVANADASNLLNSVRVSTYAGSGANTGADGYRTSAGLGTFRAVCQGDGPLTGSIIATTGNSIRRIFPDGTVTTLAGSFATGGFVDGVGAAARFNYPSSVACDASGCVFVADGSNRRIRRISPSGDVTTVAGYGTLGALDGTGNIATFYDPTGIAVSASGDRIYVTDVPGSVRLVRWNSGPRELSTSYLVTTVAGTQSASGLVDGTGGAARFGNLRCCTLLTDPSGVETLFVSDFGNNAIRRISAPATTGVVTTIAGDGVAGDSDGPGNIARFYLPNGITGQWIDSSSFTLFVTDNHRVRAITYAAGGSPTQKASYVVQLVAGTTISGSTDGSGAVARFIQPAGLTATGSGASATLYVPEGSLYGRLRQVIVPSGALHSGGPASAAQEPVRVTNWDSERPGSGVWTKTMVSSSGLWNADLQFYIPSGVSGFSFLATIETDSNMTNLPAAGASTVTTLVGGTTAAFADGANRQARLSSPRGVAAVPVAMRSLYRSPSGSPIRAFIIDAQNFRVRFLDTDGYVGTWAGAAYGTADGVGSAAQFSDLCGCAIAPDGSLLVTDGNRIRRVWPNQQVTSVAGSTDPGSADGAGGVAQFWSPRGLTVTTGWHIYVVDTVNHTIRRIELSGADPRSASSYTVSTVAGSPGSSGLVDGVGALARFYMPYGIAADTDGRVYVADYANQAVRVLSFYNTYSMEVTTLATGQSAPLAVAVDTAHNVYVSRYVGRCIGRISPIGGDATVAGDWVQGFSDGAAGRIWGPWGLAVEESGTLLVSDFNALRAVSRVIDTAAP